MLINISISFINLFVISYANHVLVKKIIKDEFIYLLVILYCI